MRLNLLHLLFSLTLDGMIVDPFDLFDLSRRFPRAFRQVTCGRVAPCGDCHETAGCPWFPLFGQQLSTDPESIKRHQKPPLPFVFALPLLEAGEHAGSDLEIELILVGSAVNHAADFIRAMARYLAGDGAGSNLSLTLDGIATMGLFGERYSISLHKQSEPCGDLRILPAEDIAAKTVRDRANVMLTFLSPLRQFRDGRLLRSFDCSAFLRNLIRRISSLIATYGDGEQDADFRRLAELSRDVVVKRNDLVFTPGSGPNRSGVRGSVCLSGELGAFLPYLFLGEYLHAGKGASWGFGGYKIGD